MVALLLPIVDFVKKLVYSFKIGFALFQVFKAGSVLFGNRDATPFELLQIKGTILLALYELCSTIIG
jgi:hypothetical protein